MIPWLVGIAGAAGGDPLCAGGSPTPYNTKVLGLNPQSLWKLDEASAPFADSGSAGNNSNSLAQAPQYQQASLTSEGDGYSIRGTSSAGYGFGTPDDADNRLSTANAFSVVAIFKFPYGSGTFWKFGGWSDDVEMLGNPTDPFKIHLSGKDDATGKQLRITVELNQGGGSGDKILVVGYSAHPLPGWGSSMNLAVTYDGSKDESGITMYINGSSISHSASTNTLSSTVTSSGMNFSAETTISDNVYVDNIALWNTTELTAVQIADIDAAMTHTC